MVSRVWACVENKLFKLCNHRLRITPQLVYRGELPKNIASRPVALTMIYQAAQSIWQHRNTVLKEGKSPNADTILRSLCWQIKLQAEVQRKIIPWQEFFQLWGKLVCVNESEPQGPLQFQDWLENPIDFERSLLASEGPRPASWDSIAPNDSMQNISVAEAERRLRLN